MCGVCFLVMVWSLWSVFFDGENVKSRWGVCVIIMFLFCKMFIFCGVGVKWFDVGDDV